MEWPTTYAVSTCNKVEILRMTGLMPELLNTVYFTSLNIFLLLCCRVMAVPATMVYFTAYDKIKYAMGYNEKDPNTRFIPILAGTTSRSK